MLLKKRSQGKEASDLFQTFLLCKILSKTPREIREEPYEDMMNMKIVMGAVLEERPDLMMGL